MRKIVSLILLCVAVSCLFVVGTKASDNDIKIKDSQILRTYRDVKMPKNAQLKIDDLQNRAVFALWQGNPSETLKVYKSIRDLRIKLIWPKNTDEIIKRFEKKKLADDYDGFMSLIKGWAYLSLANYKKALENFKAVSFFGVEDYLNTEAVIGQALALMGRRHYKDAISVLATIHTPK
ncbi:MAG TPA: hypothetical protein VMW66_04990, partial [Elusimicrobiales bacterium]|nr:hypothetical protein [Elusimicrobiales bacterium]